MAKKEIKGKYKVKVCNLSFINSPIFEDIWLRLRERQWIINLLKKIL